MTTLTLRRINDDFIVTGPDIEPAKFESRSDAKYWCVISTPARPSRDRRGRVRAWKRNLPRKFFFLEGVLAQPKSKTPPGFSFFLKQAWAGK